MQSQCQSEAVQNHLEQQLSAACVIQRLSPRGNTLSSVPSVTPLVHIEFSSSMSRGGGKKIHLPSNIHRRVLIHMLLSGDGGQGQNGILEQYLTQCYSGIIEIFFNKIS